MKKAYTIILTVLQLLVGVLALACVIRTVTGAEGGMPLAFEILLCVFAFVAGVRNLISLKKER